MPFQPIRWYIHTDQSLMQGGESLLAPRPPVGKRWPRAWRRSPFSGSGHASP